MANVRVIARLDVKGPNLVKGVQLEGIRVLGDPQEYAKRYYEQGADEIIYIDVVASLYGRNSLLDIVQKTARDVFIPTTVGGGIRSVEDAKALLRAGADKIAINTAAIRRPELITELATRFGSQCVVASIEAKKTSSGGWEAYTESGREHSGLDAIAWAKRVCELGAGEILLTSVDREGTGRGFDVELTRCISTAVPVPVIASGGFSREEHAVEVVRGGAADAIAIAGALHYGKRSLADVRRHLTQNHISVRMP